MPDSSIDVFNERIVDVMKTISKEGKLSYFFGDLSIHFLKQDAHVPTSTSIDIMYSYNMFPLITKPTRSLIDHILNKNFNISGHYAIFHIGQNTNEIHNDFIITRDSSHRNVSKFVHKIKSIDWSSVTTLIDAQSSYSEFHKIIEENYDNFLPMKEIVKRCYSNKHWLTTALSKWKIDYTSIKIKLKIMWKEMLIINDIDIDLIIHCAQLNAITTRISSLNINQT